METNETAKAESVPAAVESARVRGREKLRAMAETLKEKSAWLLGGMKEGALNTAAYVIESKDILKSVHEFGLRMDNRVAGAIEDLERKGQEGLAAAGKQVEEWKSEVWHAPGRMAAAIARKIEAARNEAAVRAAEQQFESLTREQQGTFLQRLQEKVALLDVPEAANDARQAIAA